MLEFLLGGVLDEFIWFIFELLFRFLDLLCDSDRHKS